MPGSLVVTGSVAEAVGQAQAGRHVVLVVDASASASVARSLADALAEGAPGRVHLFIGRAGDPAVADAAEAMAAELGARLGK